MKEIISLMMVTFNRLDLTKQTLNSIYNTIGKIEFNLIIVDNGSTDGTAEFLKNYQHTKNNVHIIFNKGNLGIARGRNQALKAADTLQTDWYCTVDNDVLLPLLTNNDWLTECINIMKHNPQYGMVGVSFEPIKYKVVNLNGYEFESKPQGNLGTACMVMSKKVHDMIGFFAESYSLYGEEDSDAGWRARVCGFKLGYIMEHGVHLGEGTADPVDYRKFKDECRKQNLNNFYENCKLYANGKKSVYIPFKERL